MQYLENIETRIADHKRIIELLEQKKDFITSYSVQKGDRNDHSNITHDRIRPFEDISASNWDIIYASETKIIHLLQQLEAKNRQIQFIQKSMKPRDEICDVSVKESLSIQGYRCSSVENFEGIRKIEDEDAEIIQTFDLNNCSAEVQNEDDQTVDVCSHFRKKYLDATNALEALQGVVTELRQSNAALAHSLQAVKSEKDFLSQQFISFELNGNIPLTKNASTLSLESSQGEILSTMSSELALNQKTDKIELEELRLKYFEATNKLSESHKELEDLQQRHAVLEQSLQVVTSAKCSLSLQVDVFETKIAAYEQTINDLERDLRAKEDPLPTNPAAVSSLEVTDRKADSITASHEVTAGKTGGVIKDLKEKLSKALGMKHSKESILPNVRSLYRTVFTQTDAPLLLPQDPSSSLSPHANHSSLSNYPSQNITPALSRRSSFTLGTSEKVYVTPKIRDPDQEALETGLLLSQQQAEFGINMLDALLPEDEPALQQLMQDGLSREEGTYFIFRDRYILPARQQSKDGVHHSDIKIMAMPHLHSSEIPSHSSVTSTVGDTYTVEAADYFDSQHGGREVHLHRTLSTASNMSNSSGGWIEPSSDFDAPTDTSRRRSSPLSLTSQVLRETAGPDEEKMSWYHNKLYQTPSSATSSSIANRQTPKQVYSHPTSTRRSSLVDDRLLTRQLYQSPAEALHAINQRRKSRELLRPLSTEEYLLSIDLLMRKHALSREDATDLYWRRLKGNRTVFSQQF